MKKRILALLLAALLLASLTACGSNEDSSSENAATPPPIGTAVEIASAQRGMMATENTLSGQVIADKSVAVVPLAQGTVSGLDVEVGDTVSEGELLFTIDTSTVTAGYGALSSSYEATQEMTDQAIKNAEIGIENARIGRENAQLALDNAMIGLENAQTNLYNTQQLFLIGAASQLELNAAVVHSRRQRPGLHKPKLPLNKQIMVFNKQKMESHKLRPARKVLWLRFSLLCPRWAHRRKMVK